MKLVEVIPSPLTKSNITDRTVALMKDIGQSPVVVRKEVNGFILNRLQYAVLMEAWRLVEVNCGRINVHQLIEKYPLNPSLACRQLQFFIH